MTWYHQEWLSHLSGVTRWTPCSITPLQASHVIKLHLLQCDVIHFPSIYLILWSLAPCIYRRILPDILLVFYIAGIACCTIMAVTTAEICRVCIDCLRGAASNVQVKESSRYLPIRTKIVDLLERLCLWIGNADAMEDSGTSLSLEHRLRGDRDVLDRIMHLLQSIHEAASDRKSSHHEKVRNDVKQLTRDSAKLHSRTP